MRINSSRADNERMRIMQITAKYKLHILLCILINEPETELFSTSAYETFLNFIRFVFSRSSRFSIVTNSAVSVHRSSHT